MVARAGRWRVTAYEHGRQAAYLYRDRKVDPNAHFDALSSRYRLSHADYHAGFVDELDHLFGVIEVSASNVEDRRLSG